MLRLLPACFFLNWLILISSSSSQAQGCGSSASEGWETQFGYPGVFTPDVRASTIASNGKIYFGGSDNSLFARDVNIRGIAAWDGEKFQNIGKMYCSGCGGTDFVYAMAADDQGNIYFGGNFSGMDDSTGNRTSSPNIIGFNTNTGTFFPLGKGLSNTDNSTRDHVLDLFYRNDTLFIAGQFNQATQINNSQINCSLVAGYDLNTGSYFDLDGGIKGSADIPASQVEIRSIAASQEGRLYFGGYADQLADNRKFKGLASWRPSDAWTLVPDLLFYSEQQADYVVPNIYDLEISSSGELLVSGSFRPQVINPSDPDYTIIHLALFQNNAWSYLDEFEFETGVGVIEKIFPDPNSGNQFILTGNFINTQVLDNQNDPAPLLAGIWNIASQNFSPIAFEDQEDFTAPGPVYNCNFHNGQYYFLGKQTGMNNFFSPGITQWNGQNFMGMGQGVGGSSGTVFTYTEINGKLLVGGDADNFGSLFKPAMAYWNGNGWEAFAHEFDNSASIHALEKDGNTLWIGGKYQQIDNDDVYGICSVNLNTQSITSFGDGIAGASETVKSIKVFQNKTYIGGDFEEIDNENADGNAVFDGNNWTEAFELDGNRVVNKFLNLGDSLLLIAGDFSGVGGNSDYAYLFGFDGSNLIQLWGDAANGPVLDILYNPNNNRLEVAGEFTELSSNFGSSYTLNAPIVSIDFNGNIFEKSNLNFNNIAEGIDHLALSGQQLIIGGNFSTINGKDFGELFFYDGNSPQSLAGSLEFFSGGVQSMYVQEGKLWVGGGIMRANGFPSTNIAQYSLGSVSGNGSVVVDMIPEDNIEHYDVLSYCIPNPEPGANYVWSNGDTGPCTIFTESGYQTITATGFPCYAPDSVLVEIIYAGFTRGGFGDGFDDGLVENQNATFFSGGYGDGFDGEIFENNSPGFFAGGFGDGFDSDEFVNDNPTFFAGGFGDGFDSELKENNSPTFFSGGFGDGFDTEEFKNQSPTFFRGGFGDGFDCAENDGYDLAIRNLSTVPGQPTNQPQTLLVWVINEGSVPVDDYEIEILEEGQQLYTEGFSKLVAPGDSIQNKLTTEWRPQENGQFELCAVLLGAGDYNPNNDSTCFTATSTVGIAQLFSSEGILVSPNPFSNQINIRFTQPKEKLQLELIAADGKRVLMQTIRKATHEIILDTQNLAKGFYSLRIQGKDLNLSHKILKSE